MPSMYGASSGQKRILFLLDLEEVAFVRTSKARVEMEDGVVARPSFYWE